MRTHHPNQAHEETPQQQGGRRRAFARSDEAARGGNVENGRKREGHVRRNTGSELGGIHPDFGQKQN